MVKRYRQNRVKLPYWWTLVITELSPKLQLSSHQCSKESVTKYPPYFVESVKTNLHKDENHESTWCQRMQGKLFIKRLKQNIRFISFMAVFLWYRPKLRTDIRLFVRVALLCEDQIHEVLWKSEIYLKQWKLIISIHFYI